MEEVPHFGATSAEAEPSIYEYQGDISITQVELDAAVSNAMPKTANFSPVVEMLVHDELASMYIQMGLKAWEEEMVKKRMNEKVWEVLGK